MKHHKQNYIEYITWILEQDGKVRASEFQNAFPHKFDTLDAAYAVLRRISMAIKGRANHSERRNYNIFNTIKLACQGLDVNVTNDMFYDLPGKSKYAKDGERAVSVSVGKSVDFSDVKVVTEDTTATGKRDRIIADGYRHDIFKEIFQRSDDDVFFIARASNHFRKKFGDNAFRIAIRYQTAVSNAMVNTTRHANIRITQHYGLTVSGYDFEDNRKASELVAMCNKLNNIFNYEVKRG